MVTGTTKFLGKCLFNIPDNNYIFKELSILVHAVGSGLPAFTKSRFLIIITTGLQICPG
jgi:hypothetical protein